MNWFKEGERWFNRWTTNDGFRLYGPYMLTHLRALLRLTGNSEEWLAAKAGFYSACRSFNASM